MSVGLPYKINKIRICVVFEDGSNKDLYEGDLIGAAKWLGTTVHDLTLELGPDGQVLWREEYEHEGKPCALWVVAE
ncbi:MAG: hypothetical protein J7J44_02500 [Deltaproteobacteria bacterium]|nr:hypothetical protein [Deltaproteobacteria bacterium]